MSPIFFLKSQVVAKTPPSPELHRSHLATAHGPFALHLCGGKLGERSSFGRTARRFDGCGWDNEPISPHKKGDFASTRIGKMMTCSSENVDSKQNGKTMGFPGSFWNCSE